MAAPSYPASHFKRKKYQALPSTSLSQARMAFAGSALAEAKKRCRAWRSRGCGKERPLELGGMDAGSGITQADSLFAACSPFELEALSQGLDSRLRGRAARPASQWRSRFFARIQAAPALMYIPLSAVTFFQNWAFDTLHLT